MSTDRGRIFLNAILFLVSVCALMYPAIDNGYPLLYPDSGTYIAAGFEYKVPVDRPYLYAFFVRHVSLSYSLWLVIIAQAVTITLVTWIFVRHVTGIRQYIPASTALILFLTLTTGIAHYTCQIMADIFSGVAILGICCLLFFSAMNIWERIFVIGLVIFSAMAHSSNLLLLTMMAGMAVVLMRFFRKHQAPRRQIVWTVLIIGSSWILLCSLNAVLGAGFKVSRAPNIFVMARLAHSGILHEYLA